MPVAAAAKPKKKPAAKPAAKKKATNTAGPSKTQVKQVFEKVRNEIGVSPVFWANYNARSKIVVNQGGTRSGKTYSIVQLIVFYWCKKFTGLTISIVRKTRNSIRTTVFKDFKEIMESIGAWNDADYNKSEMTYQYRGNTVEFLGMDNAGKKRGAKRHVLYCNEANELSKEDWIQLIMRTTMKAYLDYNPSDEYHWIYDDVIPREDAQFIRSTYLDNYDFLPAEVIQEIERLRDTDPDYWKIYGLGETASASNTIYPKWSFCKQEEIEAAIKAGGTVTYGLDFGFNHPTSLVRTVTLDDAVYIEDLIYKSGLTTSDLIREMKELGINRSDEIFADCARPDTIAEINMTGLFNIKSADKSVKEGISYVKSKKIYVESGSVGTLKEIKSYRWKTLNTGENTDDPVKVNDDAMDAMRYAVYSPHAARGKIITAPAYRFGAGRRR